MPESDHGRGVSAGVDQSDGNAWESRCRRRQSGNNWLDTLFRDDRAIPHQAEGAEHLTQVGERDREDEVLAS